MKYVVFMVLFLSACKEEAASTPAGPQVGTDTDPQTGTDTDADAAMQVNSEDLEPLGPGSGATCPANSTLTYENFARDFFGSYCVPCHTAFAEDGTEPPKGRTFDTVEEIRLWPNHIDQLAAGGPDQINSLMPPADLGVTDEERKQLGEWLACGAP